MIREWFGFIIFGLAMVGLIVYGATRPEPKWCSDYGLGINGGGKCLSYGSDK